MNQNLPSTPPRGSTVFGRGSYAEALRIGTILRKETVGGALLVVAAVIAIFWANSPWAESYFALRDFKIGYEPWHLDLSLGAWAADGLLAIFFFLVGLELKREFVAGDLRQISKSVVPSRRRGRRSGCPRPDLRPDQPLEIRRHCGAGRSPPPPTSPSPWPSWRSLARTCPAPCGSSC